MDGHDLRQVTRASLASQMSMVLQEPFLFSDTVAANIRYRNVDATAEQVVEAAEEASSWLGLVVLVLFLGVLMLFWKFSGRRSGQPF